MSGEEQERKSVPKRDGVGEKEIEKGQWQRGTEGGRKKNRMKVSQGKIKGIKMYEKKKEKHNATFRQTEKWVAS